MTIDQLPYSVDSWRGHETHRCRLCSWDTTAGVERFWLHWYDMHHPKDVLDEYALRERVNGGVLVDVPREEA